MKSTPTLSPPVASRSPALVAPHGFKAAVPGDRFLRLFQGLAKGHSAASVKMLTPLRSTATPVPSAGASTRDSGVSSTSPGEADLNVAARSEQFTSISSSAVSRLPQANAVEASPNPVTLDDPLDFLETGKLLALVDGPALQVPQTQAGEATADQSLSGGVGWLKGEGGKHTILDATPALAKALPAITSAEVSPATSEVPGSEPAASPRVGQPGGSIANTPASFLADEAQALAAPIVPPRPGPQQNPPKSGESLNADALASARHVGEGTGKQAGVSQPASHPGTLAAESESVMVTTNQWNIIADAAGKNLPGHGLAAVEAPGEARALDLGNDWAAPGRAMLHLPTLGFTGPESDPRANGTSENIPSRLEMAEQVQQLFTEATVHWRLLRTDTWQVVLKPDADTELTLQFHLQNGNIHAVAQCQPGDFPAFSAQWSELQNRMADQGVRLAALEPTTEAFSGFTNGNHQPPSGGQSSSEAFASSELPLTAPIRPRRSSNRTVRAVLVNGEWECWA